MRRLLVAAVAVLLILANRPLVPNAIAGRAPAAPPPFARPTLAPSVQAMASPEQAHFGVPVHVRRLSDRAIVVTLGDYAWANQTVALASKRGLVVVDTQASRTAGRLVKAAIEKAFNRSDFAYVINTHQHYDHTNGNPLYSGVPVIGHQACATGMREDAAAMPETLARLVRARQGFQEELKALDPKSEKAGANREYVELFGAIVDEARNGHVPAYPTVTFSDAMALHLGDLTVRLYSLPAGHTPGDLVVHVPEESLLCVGDMIAEGWLPVLDARARPDPNDLLSKWRTLLEQAAGAGLVIMGHGFSKGGSEATPTTLSFATLTWRYAYLRKLWDGVCGAKAAGRSLDETKTDLAIERAFPDLKDKRRAITGRDGAPADAHVQNIEMLWRATNRGGRALRPQEEGPCATHGDGWRQQRW